MVSDQKRLIAAIDSIAANDSDVSEAVGLLGYPQPRVRPAGFETFLSIIVSQQLSTEAGAAIMRRLRELMPEMTARQLLEKTPGQLRDAGLSARKVEYARGLACAIVDGDLDIDALHAMDDDSAIGHITALRGFGVWSAEIYLMFSLRREDIFPAADLALQVALQRLKGLNARPGEKQARELVAHWSPWRSAGSLFLWHYYRGAPT